MKTDEPTTPPIRCAHDCQWRVDELKPNPRNPNTHPPEQIQALAKIINHQGWRSPIVVSNLSGFIVAGHGRYEAALILGVESVPVNFQDFETEADEWAHMVADNRLAELADMNESALTDLLIEMDTGAMDLTLTGFDENALAEMVNKFGDDDLIDAEPQIDRAKELAEKWGTKLGQVWELGEHRVACGDSTAPETLAKLMGNDKAALLHADPPYGMGKEKDGVANDNLYRAKLDAFQMDWWRACRPHLEDNASAYIWGWEDSLMSLYLFLRDNEGDRITKRNYIIWAKKNGQGMSQESLRRFSPVTEHALFFMLGEQGFNNNADNYWEGWEPIRAELTASCEAMGWSGKDVERITGVGMFGHWFTKSQWTFIPAEHYNKLRDAARGDAFKREHDELKREHDELKREHDELKRDFYATRAYFDNTHDNMTDVWQFERVTGDERHGHATPKPVDMMMRCIKTSTPEGAIVLEPFIGSGSTLMACENLGRKCRGIELSPEYIAVTLQRWHEATGKHPEQIS